jgi:hypothetical protein
LKGRIGRIDVRLEDDHVSVEAYRLRSTPNDQHPMTEDIPARRSAPFAPSSAAASECPELGRNVSPDDNM